MGQKRIQASSGDERPKRQLRQQTLTAAVAAAATTGAGKRRQQQQPQQALPPAPQLHELRVVSVRQAMRGGSFRASFEHEYKDWAVFNVTSKSQDAEMVMLSPFYCHNNIPVPGLPGTTASSTERIWQCLKVFESEAEDLGSLGKQGMSGVKRSCGGKRGKVLGHAWYGGSSSGGVRVLLPYVQARKQIFLPAYSWVLEHKVQVQLRRIAQAALRQRVVLLDYETNCSVEDASRPLSHASLAAAYLRQHWQSLVA